MESTTWTTSHKTRSKKLHKALISFMVALVLVFSFEVSKPKAVVPLLPIIGGLVTGIAAESLGTMGYKAISKAVMKARADDYAAKATANGGFNWMDANPYRNKDGSITISPTTHDRAKMAGLIAGASAGLFAESMLDAEGNPIACPDPNAGIYPNAEYYSGVVDPALTDSESIRMAEKGQKLISVRKDGSNYSAVSNVTGSILDTFTNTGILTKPEIGYDSATNEFIVLFKYAPENIQNVGLVANGFIIPVGHSGFGGYLSALESANTLGASVSHCGGLFVPSTVQQVYRAPMDMSSSVTLPNEAELAALPPITINNVMPASETEGEITWKEIQDYLDANAIDPASLIDPLLDDSFNKMNAATTTYTVDDIYNVYTDDGNDIKVGEFNPYPVETTPEPTEPTEPTGELEPVAPINRNMLTVIKESYSYLSDSIETALSSMRNVTDGAQGIVTYLNQSMGWLPAEWRGVFASAFILGVFAHFFRR